MAEEGAGVQIDARTAQPLGKLLLRPGGNPHRERPGPGAAQPPQSAVMPATAPAGAQSWVAGTRMQRSEEHTTELQSLMRQSYAVVSMKKKQKNTKRYTK